MRVLCDTNVLVRAVCQDDPDHSAALGALAHLRSSGWIPVVVPQCIVEFYAVVTRPREANGIGLAPSMAAQLAEDFMQLIPLLRDERQVFDHWLTLVKQHEVQGKQTHDTRIVAAMDRHQVQHLLTFNTKHFRRFNQLSVLSPNSVLRDGIPA